MESGETMRWLGLATIVLVASCTSTKSIYSWGDYQGSVYRMTHEEDGFEIGQEIESLEAHFKRTEESGALVPPGYLLHLGYLHFLTGDVEGARYNFELEKSRFPESGTFVDDLIGRLEARS